MKTFSDMEPAIRKELQEALKCSSYALADQQSFLYAYTMGVSHAQNISLVEHEYYRNDLRDAILSALKSEK